MKRARRASGEAKVRLAVLGTGSMAANHARLFQADRRVDVVAAADVDAARAKTFADKHGIATSFGSLDELLAWGQVRRHHQCDARCGASSDDDEDHRRQEACVVREAAGGELSRWPMRWRTPPKRQVLINMVNLSYRNVAALQKARSLIAAGEIGEVRHVEASYRQSWLVGKHWGDWRTEPMWLWRLSEKHGSKGVLGDVGIHILDFATYAIGMMPVSLQARRQDLPQGRRRQDRRVSARCQ